MPPDDGRVPARAAPTLIERYEQIAEATRAMRDAARALNWDEVARLEAVCRAQIALLKRARLDTRLSAIQQRRRVELLRAILADDAEIRARAEPWLRQLERLVPRPRATPPRR